MARRVIPLTSAFAASAAATPATTARRLSATPIAFASDRSGNLDIYMTGRLGLVRHSPRVVCCVLVLRRRERLGRYPCRASA